MEEIGTKPEQFVFRHCRLSSKQQTSLAFRRGVPESSEAIHYQYCLDKLCLERAFVSFLKAFGYYKSFEKQIAVT